MTLLADVTIKTNYPTVVTPLVTQKVKVVDGVKAFSFGLGHAGYDIRAGRTFYKFKDSIEVIDPKRVSLADFEEIPLQRDEMGEFIILAPFGFCLAVSMEYIRMPRNVLGLMTNKSSYVRVALLQPSTVLEPDWEGDITVELSNLSNKPIRVYAGEGIAQVLFFETDQPCEHGYGEGKYQAQTGVTPTRM